MDEAIGIGIEKGFCLLPIAAFTLFLEALAALARKPQDEEAAELPAPEVSEKAAVEVEGVPWPGLALALAARKEASPAAEVQCSLTEQGELVMPGSPERKSKLL